MSIDNRAYLTVVEWPRHWSEAHCVTGLAQAAGLDPYNAELAVKRGIPGVVAMIDVSQREAALKLLREHHATALAPTRYDLEAAPQPIDLKGLTLEQAPGGPVWRFTSWRRVEGEMEGAFSASQLFLLVRATLRSSESTSRRGSRGAAASGAAVGFLAAGVAGAAIGAAIGASHEASGSSSTSTKLSEILDLYTTDDRRFRIVGARFDYESVLAQRHRSPRENLDELTKMLTGMSPRMLTDNGFMEFRCSPDIARTFTSSTSAGTTRRSSQAPAFDFYSAWAWLLYRQLTGAAQ